MGTTEETGPKPGNGETEEKAEEETEAGTEEGTEAGAHTAPADLISDPPAGPSADPPADPPAGPPAGPSAGPSADPSADPSAGPSADPSADPLSIPMDRLKEMAQDTEATAQVFLKARGGEPLDCPRCGSSAHTRRAPGKEQRPDIFRCTQCKAAFGDPDRDRDAQFQGDPRNMADRNQARG